MRHSHLAHILRALGMLIIVTSLVCAFVPTAAASPALVATRGHVGIERRPLASSSSCIDIQYNGFTYQAGATLPPFPKNIYYAIYGDWSQCLYAQYNSFSIVASVYTAQGNNPVTSGTYICWTAAVFCDVTHTFSFNTSQTITWFTIALYDTTNPSPSNPPLYEADYGGDAGGCTHALVDADSSYLHFTYAQGSQTGTALATVWQVYSLTPQSTCVSCQRFYAKVTYKSYGGLPGKGAIWLYDHTSHSYLASAPTPYIGADTEATSGFTNTVTANAIDVKLGVAGPNSNSAYVTSPMFYGPWSG